MDTLRADGQLDICSNHIAHLKEVIVNVQNTKAR